MKALVPDRAMVPSASTISSRLMPMPLSSTVRRRFSASIRSVMRGFGSSPSRAGLAIASKRSLSQASAALEISSRRNTSRSE